MIIIAVQQYIDNLTSFFIYILITIASQLRPVLQCVVCVCGMIGVFEFLIVF